MKQHITPKQLNELSEKEKEKLWEWIKKGTEHKLLIKIADGHKKLMRELSLLSLGQMIEFLGEDWHRACFSPFADTKIGEQEYQMSGIVTPNNLCDNLWEAVKEILND